MSCHLTCRLAALVLTLTGATLYAQSRPASPASPQFPAGIANPFQQEQQEAAAIPQETLEQSLDRLGRVGLFYRPPGRGRSGGGGGAVVVPLPAAEEQAAIQMILDNPRVGKVYHDLKALPKDNAAKLLSAQLQTALKTYKDLYQAQSDTIAQARKIDPKNLGMRVDISDDPNGAPNLVGTRLRILALLAFAGNLELTAAAPAVRDAATTALGQRKNLYDENGMAKSDRHQFLRAFSLYHRSILLTAAAGALPAPAAQPDALKKHTPQPLGTDDFWIIAPADGTAPDSLLDAVFVPPASAK